MLTVAVAEILVGIIATATEGLQAGTGLVLRAYSWSPRDQDNTPLLESEKTRIFDSI